MLCKTSSHVIPAWRWPYVHLPCSSNEAEQNFQHHYRNRATLSNRQKRHADLRLSVARKHVVRFVDVHKMDVVEDILSSNILACNCRAAYLRIMNVCKMKIRNYDAFHLLLKLDRHALVEETLGTRHLDGRKLYVFSERETYFSWFRSPGRLSRTITSLQSVPQMASTATPWPFLTIFKLGAWIRTMKTFWPLHCSLIPWFRKPK